MENVKVVTTSEVGVIWIFKYSEGLGDLQFAKGLKFHQLKDAGFSEA
jgi:hypothetical protein